MKRFGARARWAAFFFAAAMGVSIVSAADNLKLMSVSPNPVRVSQGNTQAVFNRVTEDVHVQIFSARGALVREFFLDASGGAARWDLKNDAGENVASGVYICLVTNRAGERQKAKVAIIR